MCLCGGAVCLLCSSKTAILISMWLWDEYGYTRHPNSARLWTNIDEQRSGRSRDVPSTIHLTIMIEVGQNFPILIRSGCTMLCSVSGWNAIGTRPRITYKYIPRSCTVHVADLGMIQTPGVVQCPGVRGHGGTARDVCENGFRYTTIICYIIM